MHNNILKNGRVFFKQTYLNEYFCLNIPYSFHIYLYIRIYNNYIIFILHSPDVSGNQKFGYKFEIQKYSILECNHNYYIILIMQSLK